MDHRNFTIAMRVATVTAMFALATAAEAQRSSTHKPTTKASSQPIVPDGRRTGFVLGVYTMAAPGDPHRRRRRRDVQDQLRARRRCDGYCS